MNRLKQYLRYAHITFSGIMCLLMLIGTVTLASPPDLKPVEIDTSSLEEQVSQAQAERQAEESARARESAEMSAAAASAEASRAAAGGSEGGQGYSEGGQAQTTAATESAAVTESMTETEPLTETEKETETETEAPETLSEKEKKKILSSVTAVGDSVLLGAEDDVKDLIPDIVFDAKVSRQLRAAISVLKDLGREDKLGKTVVVAIGTNGVVSKSDAQDMVDYLGPDRTIYWIDCYGIHLSWQDRVNGIIEDIAEANDNVNVIHWSKLAARHHEWLSSDGIHLRPRGRVAYAELIYKTLIHEND